MHEYIGTYICHHGCIQGGGLLIFKILLKRGGGLPKFGIRLPELIPEDASDMMVRQSLDLTEILPLLRIF